MAEESATAVFVIKFNEDEFELTLDPESLVLDLKMEIEGRTRVLAEQQKLLGLRVRGKNASDECALKDIRLKKRHKLILMGTPADEWEEVERPDDLPEVVNDLEQMQPGQLPIHQLPENLAKLQHRLNNYKLFMLEGPRAGKKCLVLDIDYTIYHLGAVVETSIELMRPHLLEFLTKAYEHYDLVIWSANSYKWIKVKMEEMKVFNNPNFKISCCLDHGAMIGLHSKERGLFSCKPLQVLWHNIQEYTPENTIMFDDLRRNFVMNPQQGLRIKVFRGDPTDNELLRLLEYLELIAELDSLASLRHSRWENYVLEHRK